MAGTLAAATQSVAQVATTDAGCRARVASYYSDVPLSLCVPLVMSLSGPGLAVPASPRVPEQFPPSAFTLTTLVELCYYRSVGKRFESLLWVCVLK